MVRYEQSCLHTTRALLQKVVYAMDHTSTFIKQANWLTIVVNIIITVIFVVIVILYEVCRDLPLLNEKDNSR